MPFWMLSSTAQRQQGISPQTDQEEMLRQGRFCLCAVSTHLQAESVPECCLKHFLTGYFCLSAVSWHQKAAGLLGPGPGPKWKPQILLWEEMVLEEKEHWWRTGWQNMVRYALLPQQCQAAQSLGTQGASQALSRHVVFLRWSVPGLIVIGGIFFLSPIERTQSGGVVHVLGECNETSSCCLLQLQWD